jgi:hypothetical protein
MKFRFERKYVLHSPLLAKRDIYSLLFVPGNAQDDGWAASGSPARARASCPCFSVKGLIALLRYLPHVLTGVVTRHGLT